jgi:hypothetical protein
VEQSNCSPALTRNNFNFIQSDKLTHEAIKKKKTKRKRKDTFAVMTSKKKSAGFSKEGDLKPRKLKYASAVEVGPWYTVSPPLPNNKTFIYMFD